MEPSDLLGRNRRAVCAAAGTHGRSDSRRRSVHPRRDGRRGWRRSGVNRGVVPRGRRRDVRRGGVPPILLPQLADRQLKLARETNRRPSDAARRQRLRERADLDYGNRLADAWRQCRHRVATGGIPHERRGYRVRGGRRKGLPLRAAGVGRRGGRRGRLLRHRERGQFVASGTPRLPRLCPQAQDRRCRPDGKRRFPCRLGRLGRPLLRRWRGLVRPPHPSPRRRLSR